MPTTAALTPAASILTTERLVATLANGDTVGVLASGLPVSTAQAAADTAVTAAAASDATTKANAAQAAAIAAAATDATTKASAAQSAAVSAAAADATTKADNAAKSIEFRNVTGNAFTIIFDGDSLTAGSSVGAGEGFVDYLLALPSMLGRATHYNTAVGGHTLAQRIAALSTPTTGVLARITNAATDVVYLSIWIGANGWVNATSASSFVDDLEDNYIAPCRTAANNAGKTLRVIGWSILHNLGTAYVIGEPLRRSINEALRLSPQFDFFCDVDDLFPNAGDLRFFLSDGTHLTGTAVTGGNAVLATHLDTILHTQRTPRRQRGIADRPYIPVLDKNPVIFTGATGGYFSGSMPNLAGFSFMVDFEFTPDENNSAARFLFNFSSHATSPDQAQAFYAFLTNTAGGRALTVGISGATTSDFRRATVANFIPKAIPSAGTNTRRVARPIRVQIIRGKAISSSTVDLTILLNGVPMEYTVATGGSSPPATFSDTLNTAYYLVGSRGSSGSELTGSVSGFSVWNVALNLTEAEALCFQGRQALPWYSRGTYTDVPSGSLVRGRSYLPSGGTSITIGSTTYNSGSVFNHVGSANTYTETGSVNVYPVGPLIDLDFSVRTDASPTTLVDRSGNNYDATVESVALRLIAETI